ncbi:MAG: hypothetical protein M1829_000457 [Trizodia sp. TS-e1964]|nr:MAG: hypothetical protein M1829_000457 [Trizodia sp. TS-e1964]
MHFPTLTSIPFLLCTMHALALPTSIDPTTASLEARSTSASPHFHARTMAQAVSDMTAMHGPNLVYSFDLKTSPRVTAPWTPSAPADLRVLVQVTCYDANLNKLLWPVIAQGKQSQLVIYMDEDEGKAWRPFTGYTTGVSEVWGEERIEQNSRWLGWAKDPIAAERFLRGVPVVPVQGATPLELTTAWGRLLLERQKVERPFYFP